MTRPILNNIELPAVDIAATRTFYSDAFGWEWTEYGPTYSAAQTSGLEVGLSTEATVGTAHAEGAGSAIGPLVLFQVDDIHTMLPTITECGGEIITQPYDFPGGSRFHFRDPSGNVLGIYQLTDA